MANSKITGTELLERGFENIGDSQFILPICESKYLLRFDDEDGFYLDLRDGLGMIPLQITDANLLDKFMLTVPDLIEMILDRKKSN